MSIERHKFKVLAFGMIAEKIQSNEIELEGIPSTDVLKGYLFQQYPALKDTKFGIAVNRKQVSGDSPIPNGAEIALLPPFSGG
ncbi:MoaD/ThiS family protein [Cecembia calidifontis]|jgi:molybdopterin synthase sulfur carrier subunit|uniref:Molybdopterin synthase sulfur carrier subunit n=1 Tax=Cecembia calidifontis TaxID=1187080 RepID=A0A4Q7PAQ2_9BACT|nr:MoaD/ThiS family protein [Cecembia calidifontis]RZS97353.1 molybdopterin synthase sulfur carrier subunit [Cecembia calidifontis]